MKKGLLFIGIVFTSMVMLFSSHEAKSYPNHSSPFRNDIGHARSSYRISDPGFPLNHPFDDSAPVYKAAPSFSALSSTYFIRLPQPGLFSHQSLVETQAVEKWNIWEPSAPQSLLLILCKDTISPNAP